MSDIHCSEKEARINIIIFIAYCHYSYDSIQCIYKYNETYLLKCSAYNIDCQQINSFAEQRVVEKKKAQEDKRRTTKRQELRVLSDAISKVRDTDEGEVKQRAQKRY